MRLYVVVKINVHLLTKNMCIQVTKFFCVCISLHR